MASEANPIKGLEELLLCCNDGIDITSPGVWVEGVEGAELGDGPAVLAVPELLAGPDDDTGCFLLRAFWFFEAYKVVQHTVNHRINNGIIYIWG